MFTYGAEHELADIPLDRSLPAGYGRDVKDISIVNSNGIANDPTGKMYRFGGEINTPPTRTVGGQAECLRAICDLLPEARVNYRSNLHVHIRVPGLRDDLLALRQVQRYVHENLRLALSLVEPLPRPAPHEYAGAEEYKGALRRWRRRRVSHQTLLSPKRLEHQLEARRVDVFFRREVPESRTGRSRGRPMWHAQPRLAVNLRQLRETDTVEFRHFPGTLDYDEMLAAASWCHDFMRAALDGTPIRQVMRDYSTADFPSFPKYVHWQEVRYRATVHDGTIPKPQIAANIRRILEGTFDEGPGCLSR